jgi:rubredoxin
MENFIYKYKCNKTGLTYPMDKPRKGAENTDDMKTLKLEARCPQCGGNHTLFVEEEK